MPKSFNLALCLLAFASWYPTPAAEAHLISAAVLGFETRLPSLQGANDLLGDALNASLSGRGPFQFVERKELRKILDERKLILSGLVDEHSAAAAGKLIGAKLLIIGKGYPLDDQIVLSAKIIGTETGLVETVMVHGQKEELWTLVMTLAQDVAKRLNDRGAALVAEALPPDPLPALKERLATHRLPVVAVSITERHVHNVGIPTVDPAVETEIKLLLRSCGITVADIKGNLLVRPPSATGSVAWPTGYEGVDLIISGESFSEGSDTFGDLRSCSARAEINIIGHSDGKIVLADRATTRAVDLGEQTAGKKALEAAGLELGLRILAYLADQSEARPPGDQPVNKKSLP